MTPEQDQTITRMAALKMHNNTISKVVGCTIPEVVEAKLRLGIVKPKRPPSANPRKPGGAVRLKRARTEYVARIPPVRQFLTRAEHMQRPKTAVPQPVQPEEVREHDRMIPASQRRRSLLELGKRECHWPVGQFGEEGFFFCGGTTPDEREVYCQFHRRASLNANQGPRASAFVNWNMR